MQNRSKTKDNALTEFKKALSRYDQDEDGEISSKELPIGNELRFVVDRNGTNSTEVLNNTEFKITFSLYDTTINDSVILIYEVTFTLHNNDGNDTIAEELGAFMWQLGLSYSEAEIQDLVYQLDDGKKQCCQIWRLGAIWATFLSS